MSCRKFHPTLNSKTPVTCHNLQLLEENIQHSRRLCWVLIDELLLADWHLDLPDSDTEPWQWRWTSPSKRHYATTTFAHNALLRARRHK